MKERPEKVELRVERKRGCGYRKPGGIYLISGGVPAPCGKLPVELNVCPVCHGGIKPARGWTWIDPRPFIPDGPCRLDDIKAETSFCQTCPLHNPPEKAGLVWIGEQHYSSPLDWLVEAKTMGVSRRIPAIPIDFVVGETLVMVAHRKTPLGPPKALAVDDSLVGPAIFSVFTPNRIEYVVKGDESSEDIDKLIERGLTPVHVEKYEELDNTIQGALDEMDEGFAQADEDATDENENEN